MIFDHSFKQTVHAHFGTFRQRTNQFVAMNFEHSTSNDFFQIVGDVFDGALVLAHFLNVFVERVFAAEKLFDIRIGLDIGEVKTSSMKLIRYSLVC